MQQIMRQIKVSTLELITNTETELSTSTQQTVSLPEKVSKTLLVTLGTFYVHLTFKSY